MEGWGRELSVSEGVVGFVEGFKSGTVTRGAVSTVGCLMRESRSKGLSAIINPTEI